MASISTADFKNGMCIINNGKMCTIVEFQHVKPGKGGAFVRTKLKDIKTGRVVDYTFNAGTKFDSVRLESKKMQYLYNDGADYWFMDNSTFEQMPVSADMVGSAADWLKENDEATLLYAGDELISLEPQMFVELEVTHTEPGFKGDTATNTLTGHPGDGARNCRCRRSSRLATSCRSTPATAASSSACFRCRFGDLGSPFRRPFLMLQTKCLAIFEILRLLAFAASFWQVPPISSVNLGIIPRYAPRYELKTGSKQGRLGHLR